MKNKKKVLILGTLPPPVGGVTIHIKRLLEELKRELIDFELIDLRQKGVKAYLIGILKLLKSDKTIVHYQLNNWSESVFLSMMCKGLGKKYIYTVHSFPISYKKMTTKEKAKIKWAAFFVSKFIAPSATIYQQLLDAGINGNKILIANTFLPPTLSEINENIPDKILGFVKDKKKVILANAYKLYLNTSGEDVYGLKLCIEACSKLSDSTFIFVCPQIGDKQYFDKCMKFLEKEKLEDRFLFYIEEVSLVSLFKIVNVFVRPTASDSFGISVAESLSAGVPAVASNVCERADGAFLFEKGNINDFVKKIEEALDVKVSVTVKVTNYWESVYSKVQ